MTNPYAPPTAEVMDVIDRAGDLHPADRLKRLYAVLVDSLVAVPIAGPIALAAAATGPVDNMGDSLLVLASALWFLAGAIVWAALTIIYVKRNGQTIGKKLLGIKVVRADGSPASLGRIFWLRNVVNALPSLIPLVGPFYSLADPLFIFSDRHQCLHDRIADTIVIDA